MKKSEELKDKIKAISQLNEKIDVYLCDKLLRKIERAEREHGVERSEIIWAAIKKFSKLQRQEQNKILSLLPAQDSKTQIAFRCNLPTKSYIFSLGSNWRVSINQVVAWYIKLDEQARPFRKKVQLPSVTAIEGIDYIVEKQEEDF